MEDYSVSDLQKGVNYCQNHFIEGETLYSLIREFQIPSSWYIGKCVPCLDELKIFEESEECEELVNTNFKWDLERLVKTGSCYGLACYIFQLVEYIHGMN